MAPVYLTIFHNITVDFVTQKRKQRKLHIHPNKNQRTTYRNDEKPVYGGTFEWLS